MRCGGPSARKPAQTCITCAAKSVPGSGIVTWDDSIVVAVATDDLQSMLVRLQSRPDDADLRRRAAEALDAQGKSDDAIMVLAPLVNLTGHDDDTGLPCLCRKCLPAAAPTAEANGMQFVRSFAVTGTRVLHFWQLADQHRGAVRASVRVALAARLAAQKVKAT
jgi:hypothetical protein